VTILFCGACLTQEYAKNEFAIMQAPQEIAGFFVLVNQYGYAIAMPEVND